MQVQSLSREDSLQEDVTTHSSILAWRIPMDGGAWRTTVHGVTKSRTRLKRLGTHIGVQNTSMMVLAYQIRSAVGGLVSFSLPSVQGNKV